jgi:hypothetical protein
MTYQRHVALLAFFLRLASMVYWFWSSLAEALLGYREELRWPDSKVLLDRRCYLKTQLHFGAVNSDPSSVFLKVRVERAEKKVKVQADSERWKLEVGESNHSVEQG